MITSDKELQLRYYSEEDVEILFKNYLSDIPSAKYLARSVHTNIDESKKLLRKLSNPSSLASNSKCIWVIATERDNSPVGMLTLIGCGKTIEIHIGIVNNALRKGYASKALKLAAEYCLQNGLGEEVVSFTDENHAVAQKTFKRAGFIQTCILPNHYVAPRISTNPRNAVGYKFSA